jgi:HD superfamily phosphodiesterase
MAGEEEEKKRRKRTHRKHRVAESRTSKSHRRPEKHDSTATATPLPKRPADIESLRKARVIALDKSPEGKRERAMPKYEYTRTVSQVVEGKDGRHGSSKARDRSSHVATEPSRPARRFTTRRHSDDNEGRRAARHDDSDQGYVYAREERKPGDRVEAHTRTNTRVRTKATESSAARPAERRRMPDRRHTEPAIRSGKSRDDEDEEDEEEEWVLHCCVQCSG